MFTLHAGSCKNPGRVESNKPDWTMLLTLLILECNVVFDMAHHMTHLIRLSTVLCLACTRWQTPFMLSLTFIQTDFAFQLQLLKIICFALPIALGTLRNSKL